MKNSILIVSLFLITTSAFAELPKKETKPCMDLQALRESIRDQKAAIKEIKAQLYDAKSAGDNQDVVILKQELSEKQSRLIPDESSAGLLKISCDASHGNTVFKRSTCPDGFEDVGGSSNSDSTQDEVLCHKKEDPSVATENHEPKITRPTGVYTQPAFFMRSGNPTDQVPE